MDRRYIEAGILLACVFAIIFIVSENILPEKVEISSDMQPIRDPYSSSCINGTYYVTIDNTSTCQMLEFCKSDDDCSYLYIDKLPPRIGKCVSGFCKAFCGSGILRECYN